MNPKDLVRELMVRDEPAFHNARVLKFFSDLDAAGFAIVPKEPTPAMIDAGLRATAVFLDIQGSALTVNREKLRRRYSAMLNEVAVNVQERE